MRNRNQGEGDYEAARRFNQQQQDFVKRRRRPRPDPDSDQLAQGLPDLDDVDDGADFGTEITRIRRHSSETGSDSDGRGE